MCPLYSKIYQSDTSNDEDRMSNLPGNVIDCILGKMPIRDAVRTSVLSMKWRFYYLAIPQLVFNGQFCKEVHDFLAKKNHGIFSMFELHYQFNEIVTKYLMLHPRRIETFQVSFPRYLKSMMVRDVNKWIHYLSWRNINKLTLIYSGVLNYRHKLPSYFFSCLDLTFLKLQNFIISPPPKFKGFLNLYQLKLIRVDFANNCFESFLSGCPVLERLSLRCCSGIRHFNISGSKLKRLHIKAFDNFESISLENAPNLTEVTVALERAVIGLEGSKPISDLVKLVTSLRKVKILRLNGKFLQLLPETPAPPMLSASPDSLKIFELKGVNFMDYDQICAVVWLIRSAPNLQELHIEACIVRNKGERVSGYLKLLDSDKLPLTKLCLVRLTNISGFDPEFEFIRFLLFNSPSLVTMSILEHPKLEAEEALNIASKLLQLRLPSDLSIDLLINGKKT